MIEGDFSMLSGYLGLFVPTTKQKSYMKGPDAQGARLFLFSFSFI
jgi:hypothetical protein